MVRTLIDYLYSRLLIDISGNSYQFFLRNLTFRFPVRLTIKLKYFFYLNVLVDCVSYFLYLSWYHQSTFTLAHRLVQRYDKTLTYLLIHNLTNLNTAVDVLNIIDESFFEGWNYLLKVRISSYHFTTAWRKEIYGLSSSYLACRYTSVNLNFSVGSAYQQSSFE